MAHLSLIVVYFAMLGAAETQPVADGNAPIKQIEVHFSRVKAELNRHRRVSVLGETVSGARPEQKDLDEEVQLYMAVKNAGLIKDAPEQVFELCHNLLIFSPRTGQGFLRDLIGHAATPEAMRYCSLGCLASGRFGEQLAIAQVRSGDLATRSYWSGYLRSYAILDDSTKPLIEAAESESDTRVKADLLRALGMIGGTSPLKFVQDQVQLATDDDIQAAAIFSFVELAGFDGIGFLEAVKPLGKRSENEKANGLKYLKEETSAQSRYGMEVGNSADFVARFGDLHRSPVIAWLERKGLLQDEALKHPKKLEPADKDELLKLLIDSKGFGLEAAKGSLFLSVNKADTEQLLSLRSSIWFSPNSYSNSRTKTVGLLMRHVGKSAKNQKSPEAKN